VEAVAGRIYGFRREREVKQLTEEMFDLVGRKRLYEEILSLRKQVEEMQKIIDTAVMFLQSNELHVKAEQIKAMVQSLKEDKPSES
jgi:hypothetical protein